MTDLELLEEVVRNAKAFLADLGAQVIRIESVAQSRVPRSHRGLSVRHVLPHWL